MRNSFICMKMELIDIVGKYLIFRGRHLLRNEFIDISGIGHICVKEGMGMDGKWLFESIAIFLK